MLENTYTLENGIKIPKLGLGTWFIDDSKVAEVVREAVKIGYRMIDPGGSTAGSDCLCAGSHTEYRGGHRVGTGS